MTENRGKIKRRAYTRKDGVRVKAVYENSGWMQKVNKGMEKRGTVGVFTRAKLAAGYPNTKRGTVQFANAVLNNKIPRKTSAKWHDRAALAKVFVRIANKRNR